jgi:uncharacterized protein YndB with AHSA1/START domain
MLESHSPTADREIVTTRLFDAPRELVFAAWKTPEHLEQWWGPMGFSTTTHAFDFRVGGGWRHTMHGPDGTDFPNRLVYDEIVAPKRIVYSHFGDEGAPARFQSTITFEETEGKTKLTMRQVFPSAAERDAVVKHYGAAEGAKQTLARLGDFVAAHGGRPAAELVMSRTFDAPRRLVFEAWKTAEALGQWFTPKPLTTANCKLDFRPGGIFSVGMRMPDGLIHTFGGKFVEIVELDKIVFAGAVDDGTFISTTVTFVDAGAKTTLTVHQTYSVASPSAAGAREGWTVTPDQLGQFVARN